VSAVGVWEFDVGVSTHELLRAGVLVHHYRRVRVAAASVGEAELLACQLAAHPSGVMPTEALLRV
jgi:hypothetical protein